MKDRRVIITGATGALGREVTRQALARGGRVTVAYRSEPRLDELRRAVGEPFAGVDARRVDLLDEAEVQGLFAAPDRVDVLLHLVGGFEMAPTHEVTLAGWRAHLDMGLTTTFLCCKHALARMRDGGYGRIVTVGSRAAAQPMAQAAAYSCAKAAVVALTRVIAEETKGSVITANAVLPSIIDTPANRAAMGEAAAARWVSPASLASVILFLASEAAGDVRGAAVPVYGQV